MFIPSSKWIMLVFLWFVSLNGSNAYSDFFIAEDQPLSKRAPQRDDGSISPTIVPTVIPSPAVKCVPGVKLGVMNILTPNSSTVITTGTNITVTWQYSALVKNYPRWIDVVLQSTEPGIVATWSNKIASKVMIDSPSFLWIINTMSDGRYKLRIIPESKETFNIPANLMPCFGDGDVLTANSAEFKVINPVPFGTSKDRFPPNAMGSGYKNGIFWFTLVITIIVSMII